MITSMITAHSMHATGDGTTARSVSAIAVVAAVAIMKTVDAVITTIVDGAAETVMTVDTDTDVAGDMAAGKS